jgi:hypothetical protein
VRERIAVHWHPLFIGYSEFLRKENTENGKGIYKTLRKKFSVTYPNLEIKINREIREYTESMFFGLSLRQFAFSLAAVVAAVGIYFLLKPYLGTETVSWVCVLGAAPFAAMGFVKYNGMTAERFIWAWLKSEFVVPKRLMYRAVNLYCEAIKPGMGGSCA